MIFVSFLIVTQDILAQKDSTNKVTDSINATILNNVNKEINQIDYQRIYDSINKVKLERQISGLDEGEDKKKSELQKQLDFLNEREAKRLAEKKQKIDSLRNIAKSFPVNGFFNDTLFFIYSNHGAFSAKDRAKAIEDRIHKLSDQTLFQNDSLIILETENSLELVAGEIPIMSITENDAIWNNTSKSELAKEYKEIITRDLLRYKSETSFSTIAKEIGLALLVLFIIVVAIYYIIKLFKWNALKIQQQKGKLLKGIKLKDYTLFDESRQERVVLAMNNLVKWFFILLLVYLSLPVLFGIFPWTEGLAETLIGYILNPIRRIANSLWNYLPNLFTIIVIIFVFFLPGKGYSFYQIGNCKRKIKN